MKPVILRNFLSPGDIVMLTAVVRDIQLLFPGQYEVGVETPDGQLWENNPHLSPRLSRFGRDATPKGRDQDAFFIQAQYPLIHRSNPAPWHFLHGMHRHVGKQLGKIDLHPHLYKGDIHLSEDEQRRPPNLPDRYWVMVAGGKKDFTIKWWTRERWQKTVDLLTEAGVPVVQVGLKPDNGKHVHFDLEGTIDLRGQTDVRGLAQLVYHSDGVICPVTFAMHLAAAVPMKEGAPRRRPCVVVAGGREPAQWEAYTGHRFLDTCGLLPCCDHGGCWKARTVPLHDGDVQDQSLCLHPETDTEGSPIPRCMAMITPERVRDEVLSYAPVLGGSIGGAPIRISSRSRQRVFHVCSYGGSGSWMLVKFLRQFGEAHHVHSRFPPAGDHLVDREHFTAEKDDSNRNIVRIFLYSRPEHAITRRWNWTTDHWHNLGLEPDEIAKLPATPADYMQREHDDLMRYEEFFDNYVTGRDNGRTVCVDFHRLWDNLPAFFREIGLDEGKEAFAAFPAKRPVPSLPVVRPALFEPLNRKIDRMPAIYVTSPDPSPAIRRAHLVRETGVFLGGTIGTFEDQGRDQFVRLVQHGLGPTSRLLDLGCGCLRGGYWTIPFLEPGNYFGIEPNRDMLAAGKAFILPPGLEYQKRPIFDHNDRFDFSVFGVQFDFFMLGSIWTHAPRSAVLETMKQFKATAAPRALLLASFIRTNGPTTAGDRWVGKSHKSDSPGLVAWNWDELQATADWAGDLVMEHLEPEVRGEISWLALRRA